MTKLNIMEEATVAVFVDLLLNQNWHRECVFEKKDDGQILVKYPNEHHDCYLRYSRGPLQGFFWDVYGEDMQEIELAIIALSKAPVPLNYRKAEYPVTIELPVKKKKTDSRPKTYNAGVVGRLKRTKDFFEVMDHYKSRSEEPDEVIIKGSLGGEDYCVSFRLDMDDPARYEYKLLSFLSYLTADNHYSRNSKVSKTYHAKINKYFNRNFSIDDLQKIYIKIGTGSNPELGYKFVKSGYDMDVLND